MKVCNLNIDIVKHLWHMMLSILYIHVYRHRSTSNVTISLLQSTSQCLPFPLMYITHYVDIYNFPKFLYHHNSMIGLPPKEIHIAILDL